MRPNWSEWPIFWQRAFIVQILSSVDPGWASGNRWLVLQHGISLILHLSAFEKRLVCGYLCGCFSLLSLVVKPVPSTRFSFPMMPELLAPAGNFLCLTAAIQGGCDAVYFGVDQFNMRAGGAVNFSVEDVGRIRAMCLNHGIKAYLAMNCIVFEEELEAVDQVLAEVAGQVDAVICSDAAVMQLCRKRGVPFHISTQVSISNSSAAAFYRDLGAERIVLARECSLEDIRRIKDATGIQIEAFVHGAMCVSVSGRCYLSQEVFGRSGNRGRCLQNCRREYLIKEVEEGHEFVIGQDYVMSAKDLCTIPFIEKVLEAGVDSLKIEGRSRNAEYVRTVVECYRRAVDACLAGEMDTELKASLLERLGTVYNREFSSGFYFGRPVGEFTRGRGSMASLRKEVVGVVTNYYKKPHVAEIRVDSNLFGRGDSLMVQGETTGVVTFTADQICQDEVPVDRVRRGLVTVKLESRVRANDKVYILVPSGNSERAGEDRRCQEPA